MEISISHWLDLYTRANKLSLHLKETIVETKGLAKLGNIVADANVSQFSRTGNMCCGSKF